MSEIREAHFDEDPIIRSQAGRGLDFAEIAARRLSRRDLMKAGLALAAGAAGLAPRPASAAPAAPGLAFAQIPANNNLDILVPEGYDWHVVARWGDPLTSAVDGLEPGEADAMKQAAAVGYNNDFIGYMPLPFGSDESRHGLLAMNNEYVNPELMFATGKPGDFTPEQIATMMGAVGMTVAEVERSAEGRWAVVKGSPYNLRLDAATPMKVTGPAKGSHWMKTEADPAGETVLGTLGNCSAGKTPWGTVLSAEENFQDLFADGKGAEGELRRSYDRYGIPDAESFYGWEQHQPRFRASEHPNEPSRFGWVVEIDPYDPEWQPCKRTALGRFRHEAATTFITPSGQVVLYSGDDARFEYVYKFVCSQPYNAVDRKANRDILDDGVLYVAQFHEDGSGVWLPLVQGQGPLTPENGFRDQGDVVVNVRLAADLLGATKMDRPEDMEVNPVNKKLYIACTNNTQRGTGSRPGKDKMNPRDENKHGHVIELTEAGDDHAAKTFQWEHFIVCGDPEDAETYFAGFPKDRVAAISCPDNLAFDNLGNLWIATDGMTSTLKVNDCLYAVAVEGPERGHLKRFMSAVPGAEVCGPEFTPDNRTLFLAIQHPGEGGSFAEPKTSWPEKTGAPRPSVIAIEAKDRRVIGS